MALVLIGFCLVIYIDLWSLLGP